MKASSNGVSNLTEIEVEGIKEMKILNQEFLKSGKGGKQVREFLLNANSDETLLLRFLRGRKNRPKYAWETLKQNAVVRYESYPEIFPDTLSEGALTLMKSEMFGVLKRRDSNGNVVAFLDTNKWDPDKVTLKDLHIFFCRWLDQKLFPVLEKERTGIIFIQDCSGFTMKHLQHHSVRDILRIRNVFWV